MNAEKIIVVAIIFIVCGATATYFLTQDSVAFNWDRITHEQGKTIYDYTGGVSITRVDYRPPVYNNITNDYRPKYPGMSNEEYQWIFGKLPSFPEDFYSIVQLIQDGKITDYARISSNYWKQPEFYVGWEYVFNSTYLNNDPNSWIPEGYGCYPVIKEANVDKGSSIVVNTYFKTGYATEAYQGLIIRPYLPDEAINIKGDTLFKQPEDAEKYLKVSITNEDNKLYQSFRHKLKYDNVRENDWLVVLEPTYKVITDEYNNFIKYDGFPSDWVRLLNLSVDISDNTPSGTYIVAIKIEPPCFEINQEYYFSTEHEYYGKLYNPGGRIYRTKVPHFQFVLNVE